MKHAHKHLGQDIAGKRFGRLIAKEYLKTETKYKSKSKYEIWLCKCDCGREIEVKTKLLNGGIVKSCGCLKRIRGKESPNIKCGIRKPEGEAAKNAAYNTCRCNAKARKIPFEITLAEFVCLAEKNCHYCGSSPSKKVIIGKNRNINGNFIHNGIDRIDNTIGYIVDNCVPCCKICNYAKHTMSYGDFVTWIHKLVKFNCNENYTKDYQN